MKDFIQLAQTRRSVRSYTQEPVSNEDMQYIMECARIAPSAVNFQPWHFYIVRTPELQAKLRQTYSREWPHSTSSAASATTSHGTADSTRRTMAT